MRDANHRRRGYTLVEMVTVIVIMSIIGLVSSAVIVESVKVYSRIVPAQNATYHAEHALRRMKHEIRDLGGTDSIATFTVSALTFDDSASNTIAYALSGNDLLRNGDLLATGVSALTITYLKSDGTGASAATDIHLIELDLTVQSGSQPYRIQTTIFPRVLSS